MTLLATLLLAILPHEIAARDSVDCIERNTFYNGEGDKVFTQIIFWQWEGNRHQVVAWRMEHGMNFRERRPQLTWWEGDRLRQVNASYWRETWTQVDPELEAREIVKPCQRRGLWGERR